jgi:hypothetical protein
MPKVAAQIARHTAALTPEQLSSYLGNIPVKTIRAKIRAGHIPHVRGFCKPYLIPVSYLVSMGFVPDAGGK